MVDLKYLSFFLKDLKNIFLEKLKFKLKCSSKCFRPKQNVASKCLVSKMFDFFDK